MGETIMLVLLAIAFVAGPFIVLAYATDAALTA
jgi:hypothetical protein